MAYNAKDYPRAVKAIERYQKEAGPNATMGMLLAQSDYLQKYYLWLWGVSVRACASCCGLRLFLLLSV